jgi:hypothetical protein
MSPALISSLQRWIETQVRIDTVDDAVWIGTLKQVTEAGDLLIEQPYGPEESPSLLESWLYGASIVRVRPAVDADLEVDEEEEEDSAPAIDLEALFSPPRGRR